MELSITYNNCICCFIDIVGYISPVQYDCVMCEMIWYGDKSYSILMPASADACTYLDIAQTGS
jgi:hypothetical protein